MKAAYALTTDVDTQVSSFFKIKDLGSFFFNLLQLILAIGSLAAFFYLAWGGIEFITSGGNQESIKSAKSKMTQAIVGLVILAAIWAIWRLVLYFLGLSSTTTGPINFNLPSP